MLDTLLVLLAAKAKTVALVAGTAVVTAGAVGGGAVAVQTVSAEQPSPGVAVAEDAPATPTVGTGKQGKGRGAEQRSDSATAVVTGDGASPVVTFVCDPTRNHGQNVSAYVHSLPKGKGRGALVSSAARSDCGKGGGEAEEAEAPDVEAPDVEASKPAKPATAKAAKPAKPSKAEQPGRVTKTPKPTKR